VNACAWAAAGTGAGLPLRVAAPGINVALPGSRSSHPRPRHTALRACWGGDGTEPDRQRRAGEERVLAAIPGQKLFDRIVGEDLLDAAATLPAKWPRACAGQPLPLVRDLKATHPNADAYFQFARNMSRHAKTSRRRSSAWTPRSGSERKFDDGMATSASSSALMFTPECKALRHAFFANAPQQIPTCRGHAAGRSGRWPSRRRTMAAHQHELPQRRHPVVMLEMKQEALDAAWRRSQELRQPGEEGQAQAGQARRAHGVLSTTLTTRHRDADMVSRPCSRDGRQGKVFRGWTRS